jgi:hypothetical protein
VPPVPPPPDLFAGALLAPPPYAFRAGARLADLLAGARFLAALRAGARLAAFLAGGRFFVALRTGALFVARFFIALRTARFAVFFAGARFFVVFRTGARFTAFRVGTRFATFFAGARFLAAFRVGLLRFAATATVTSRNSPVRSERGYVLSPRSGRILTEESN